nr:MAG TPA: hypothetical protein [Caudoviricetes sp.]
MISRLRDNLAKLQFTNLAFFFYKDSSRDDFVFSHYSPQFIKGLSPLFLLHRSLRAVAVEYSGFASGILANLQTKSRPHEEVKVIVRVSTGCRIGGNRLSNARTDVHVVANVANEMVTSQQEVGANLADATIAELRDVLLNCAAFEASRIRIRTHEATAHCRGNPQSHLLKYVLRIQNSLEILIEEGHDFVWRRGLQVDIQASGSIQVNLNGVRVVGDTVTSVNAVHIQSLVASQQVLRHIGTQVKGDVSLIVKQWVETFRLHTQQFAPFAAVTSLEDWNHIASVIVASFIQIFRLLTRQSANDLASIGSNAADCRSLADVDVCRDTHQVSHHVLTSFVAENAGGDIIHVAPVIFRYQRGGVNTVNFRQLSFCIAEHLAVDGQMFPLASHHCGVGYQVFGKNNLFHY